MDAKKLVQTWFEKWETGDFQHIPVSENFKHTSPYGTINGKQAYLDLVAANKDKFLGNQFELQDELYEANRACVRYIVRKGTFSMNVSEWFYIAENEIEEIISYYNIEGEISEDRQLSNLE